MLADGLTLAESEALGLTDGLAISCARNVMTAMVRFGFGGGLGLAEMEALGLVDADGLWLAEADAEGLTLALGLIDGLTISTARNVITPMTRFGWGGRSTPTD
jgi:hypothetical protein